MTRGFNYRTLDRCIEGKYIMVTAVVGGVKVGVMPPPIVNKHDEERSFVRAVCPANWRGPNTRSRNERSVSRTRWVKIYGNKTIPVHAGYGLIPLNSTYVYINFVIRRESRDIEHRSSSGDDRRN